MIPTICLNDSESIFLVLSGMPRTSQTMDNQVATTVPEVQPNPIAPILPPSTPGPSSASGTHRDKLVVIAKEKIAKELRQPRTIKRALRIPNKEIKQSTSMNDVPTSTITLSSSSDDEDVTCLSPKTFKSMDSFGETKASKLFLCRKYKPNKKGSLAVDFQPARKTFREGDFLQVHLKKSVLMRLDQLDMSCVHDEPRCPKLGSKPATGSSDNDE